MLCTSYVYTQTSYIIVHTHNGTHIYYTEQDFTKHFQFLHRLSHHMSHHNAHLSHHHTCTIQNRISRNTFKFSTFFCGCDRTLFLLTLCIVCVCTKPPALQTKCVCITIHDHLAQTSVNNAQCRATGCDWKISFSKVPKTRRQGGTECGCFFWCHKR